MPRDFVAQELGQSPARRVCLCCLTHGGAGEAGAVVIWRLIGSCLAVTACCQLGHLCTASSRSWYFNMAAGSSSDNPKRESQTDAVSLSDLGSRSLQHFLHTRVSGCHKGPHPGKWNRPHFLVGEWQNSGWEYGTENVVLAMKLRLLYLLSWIRNL